MARGKSTWKYNKLLTARRNYFVGGGSLDNMIDATKQVGAPGSDPNIKIDATTARAGNNGMNMGILGGASSIGTQAMADIMEAVNTVKGVKQKGESMIKAIGSSTAGAQPLNDNWDALNNDWNNRLQRGHVTTGALFGKNSGDIALGAIGSSIRGAGAGASLGPWGAVGGGIGGLVSSLTGNFLARQEAHRQKKKVNAAIDSANEFDDRMYGERVSNLLGSELSGLNATYAAMGGKIHIDPRNRGKFNATKRRTGKTTEELTHSSNPLTRKRAIFAQNAKKWHHAFGGELNTQGGDFTNGLLYIDNGGSHEANPYEGVQLGVDPEGTPNLVEEGETVFNDYVFSKRLKVPKAVREKYKMRSTKEMTFAEMSKEMARESEERPNDPISMRGLEALMSDLANAQEDIRETQQVRQHAQGGRLFDTGGDKGNQTLNHNNSTPGLYFGMNKSEFNPYESDGTINWDIMYSKNSPYTKRRQYVIDHWDDPRVQEWLERYVEGINEYNKGRSGYQPMTKSDITKDIFTSRTWDKAWGGMHAGIDYAGDPERVIKTQHMLRGTDGLTAMPDDAIYYAGRNAQTGYTWDERFKDQYERLDNGAYTTEYDPETNTETRTYFYSPLEKKGSGNRYYKKNANGQYELVGGENPYLDIQNAGNYNQVRSVANNQDGTDYYYDPEEKDQEYKELSTSLRYAPAVGLGIAALTDAFGLTNKPDYGNAEAVLEVAKGAGTYQPVRFNPIGNYLTYRPFDRDYYINKMNAEAGATRRSLLNTSGGNRGTAMAGILAADNNYLNQIGGLARQAEEYNLAQRQQVEDFNRSTNITNSQGFLQADIANQKALMDARESTLKGTMAAAEMRERTRLASEQAKSSNLSGLITALGDIGRENMGWNWRNFGLATGTFGNVGDEERLLTHTGKKKSKGGKMKRRKGLTI